MSDPVKRVSAEVSESGISGSRDFQVDPALASGRASGNQLGGPRFARGTQDARCERKSSWTLPVANLCCSVRICRSGRTTISVVTASAMPPRSSRVRGSWLRRLVSPTGLPNSLRSSL